MSLKDKQTIEMDGLIWIRFDPDKLGHLLSVTNKYNCFYYADEDGFSFMELDNNGEYKSGGWVVREGFETEEEMEQYKNELNELLGLNMTINEMLGVSS